MPCCTIILLFGLWEADPVVLNASLGAELSKRMTMAYRMRQEICRCVAVLEAAVRVQDAWDMRYNAPSPGHEAQMGRGNVGRRSKREQCGAASGAPL